MSDFYKVLFYSLHFNKILTDSFLAFYFWTIILYQFNSGKNLIYYLSFCIQVKNTILKQIHWFSQNGIFFDSFSASSVPSASSATSKKILSVNVFLSFTKQNFIRFIFIYFKQFSQHLNINILWCATIRGTFQAQVTSPGTSQVAL